MHGVLCLTSNQIINQIKPKSPTLFHPEGFTIRTGVTPSVPGPLNQVKEVQKPFKGKPKGEPQMKDSSPRDRHAIDATYTENIDINIRNISVFW